MGRGTALALVGAQWGSEGKGVIAGAIAHHFAAAVRTGGPNAGHSLYFERSLRKMRQVPCVWVNPEAELFIGAGAVVNVAVLDAELRSLPERVRVTIDPLAVLVAPEYEHAEAETIRATIGSTAEGVGEARVARLRRIDARLTSQWDWSSWSGRVVVGDVAARIAAILADSGLVMLEGTQGSGLSLIHGTQYPYVTSADTNASGLAADAGIAPSDVGHVHLVARSFPIRVAGNSGPMGDEMSWDWFVERGLVEQPEQTTVTRKVRRIAAWHRGVFEKALLLNRPCGIWLTFGDYLDPSIKGQTSVIDGPALEFARSLEAEYGIPVLGIGTGPVTDDRGVYDWALARLASCAHGVEW